MQNSDPKKFLSSLQMIHLSFCMAMIAFTLVVYFINDERTYDFNTMDFIFPYLVPMLVIAGIMASNFVFKLQLKKLDKKSVLTKQLAFYQSASLVKYAVIEAPVLFAIVAAFQTRNMAYLSIGAVGIAYFVMQRPNRDKVSQDLDLRGDHRRDLETDA